MTEPETTLDRIRRILTTRLGKLGAEQLEPNANLDRHLKFDGLDRVQIAMEIEEVFGREVPDDEIDAAATIADLVLHARCPKCGDAKPVVAKQDNGTLKEPEAA